MYLTPNFPWGRASVPGRGRCSPAAMWENGRLRLHHLRRAHRPAESRQRGTPGRLDRQSPSRAGGRTTAGPAEAAARCSMSLPQTCGCWPPGGTEHFRRPSSRSCCPAALGPNRWSDAPPHSQSLPHRTCAAGSFCLPRPHTPGLMFTVLPRRHARRRYVTGRNSRIAPIPQHASRCVGDSVREIGGPVIMDLRLQQFNAEYSSRNRTTQFGGIRPACFRSAGTGSQRAGS